MYFSSYKTHVKVHNFANNEIYYQLLRKTRRQNCIVCGLYYVRTNILCCSSRTMHHLLDNRLTRNVSEAGWKTELLLKLRNAFVSRLLQRGNYKTQGRLNSDNFQQTWNYNGCKYVAINERMIQVSSCNTASKRLWFMGSKSTNPVAPSSLTDLLMGFHTTFLFLQNNNTLKYSVTNFSIFGS